MARMRDAVDLPSNGGGAGAGGNGVGVGSGAESSRGMYGTGSGSNRADGSGYGRGPSSSSGFEPVEAPEAAPPPPVNAPVTSPFVQTPVQGNFFNLGGRHGGGGMGGRSPFMPTNNLLRMLEQMRMQKMNDLFYQPYLSAFGRRY